MTEDEKKNDNSVDFKSLAIKVSELFSKNTKNSLESVFLKGEGSGFYYSVSDKNFVKMPKKAEMYLLPIEKDERNRLYVFSPYIFNSGVILLIPEEDLEFVGFN